MVALFITIYYALASVARATHRGEPINYTALMLWTCGVYTFVVIQFNL